MDLLKINDNQEAFYSKNGQWARVLEIENDDILDLVRIIAENKDISMDQIDDDNVIKNPIERTIYEKLYNALQDLSANREAYLADIDNKFERYMRDSGLSSSGLES